MSTATPADQLRLLDVQAQESRRRHLSRQRQEALADPGLAAAAAAVAEAEAAESAARTAREEADAAVEALEQQGAQVSARIAKDEAQLIAGQAGAGTLQGLQREIESLTAKSAELDDLELEAMDAAEAAATVQQEAESATATARAAQSAVKERVAGVVAALDDELAAVAQARSVAADGIPAELLALYEGTLAKRGVGAARLFHGTSEGSGMALAPGDLAEIKRAAPEAVVFCPDSGVILVRDPEWA